MNVRFPPAELAALDGYIELNFEGLGRAEAIRRIVAAAVSPAEPPASSS